MTDSTTSTPAQNNPTWVVGIDGSDHATHALKWAAQMAAGREVAIDAIAAWEFSFFGQVPLPGGAIPATSIETQDEIVAGIYDLAKQVSAD
jgi:hypothetical protein